MGSHESALPLLEGDMRRGFQVFCRGQGDKDHETFCDTALKLYSLGSISAVRRLLLRKPIRSRLCFGGKLVLECLTYTGLHTLLHFSSNHRQPCPLVNARGKSSTTSATDEWPLNLFESHMRKEFGFWVLELLRARPISPVDFKIHF